MVDKKLPKYVSMGVHKIALELQGDKYYREAGLWSISYRFIEGELVSWYWGKGMPWMHRVKLTPISKKEWENDNRYMFND